MNIPITNGYPLAKIAAFALAGACLATPHASILITFEEVGSDVVATGTGSAILAGLTYVTSDDSAAGVWAQSGYAGVGPAANEPVIILGGLSGPTEFGAGGPLGADLGDGLPFFLYGSAGLIGLPNGYTSGEPLSGSATWNGQTLATMGLTPGSYTWNWGTGGNADSLTVTIGPVPEPAQWALLSGLGLVGFGLWRRRSVR